mgnify:CR=1 FL=1
MTLIKRSSDTPANAASWKAGLIKHSRLEQTIAAAAGNPDAKAMQKMVDSIESRPQTTKPPE